MSDGKSLQVKRFLEWIAPREGGLEAMAGESSFLEGIGETPWSTEEEVDRAREAVGRLDRNESISAEDADVLEAIILPKERPVVDIVDGTYATPAAPFQHLGEIAARANIEAAIPSIGRIELPDHPSLPFGGTGFVVGDGVLMTNRHVAELFAEGIGREELSFRPGQSAAIDFLRERDRAESLRFRIVSVAMVHPYWDMALLIADGLGAVPPLRLSVAPPADLREREVTVVGYPALDPRNNVDLQNRIFGGVFNIKRLQPGKLRERADIVSFGHRVSAVTHDSSTLGGNSGSAVIDVATGTVVGLHFAGRYLEANFAVPTHELALDRRIVEAGVNFEQDIAGATAPWDDFWSLVDRRTSDNEDAAVAAEPEPMRAIGVSPVAGEGLPLSWSIPLELTLQLRSQTPPRAGAETSDPDVEALVEPFRDEDFSRRPGYEEQFLGIGVPLPAVLDESVLSRLDDGSYVLPYEHFSAVVHKNRRLALFTASNVDANPARKEPEPGRDYSRRGLTGLGKNDQERWFTDPRIPAMHQLPDRFFTKDRASFDKGHIVRREDVAWGDTYDEVRRANGDTFHVTNCSPQVARFNRSNKKGVWGELENLILKQSMSERYCVFAGPVLGSDDPLFRGVDDEGPAQVAIPQQFWKIVVARNGDELETFAFVLDQDLSETSLEFAVDAPWRSRMISLPALERLVGLITFPAELHTSDQFEMSRGETVRVESGVRSYTG
jgi:endonuclease G